DHALNRFTVGRDVVDVEAVLLHAFHIAIPRVGEVDAALGMHPQVVGAVELLAIVCIGQYGDFTAGADRGHAASLSFASQQVAIAIEEQAVGSAAIFAERGELAVRAPAVDSVVGNIREVDVPLGIDGGAFGKGE